MAWFARARAWLGRMLLGRPVQQEFDEELRFHLDEETDTGVNCGLTYEQARRAAVRSLGSPPDLIKEECRDAWGLVVVSDLRRDTVLAIGELRRSPIFAAVALLTLTLAIGATVSAFSLVDAWLIRPLPFPQADRLVIGLAATHERPDDPALFLLHRDFVAWAARARSFDHLAAAFRRSYLINTGSDASEAMGLAVSGDFFTCLDVQPLLGRALSQDDSNGPPRAVLSYGLWQRLFGGVPSIVGQTISLNGVTHEIVGVMPRTFDVRLIDQTHGFEVWTPLDPHEPGYDTNGTGPVAIVGRLRDGVSVGAATREVSNIQQEEESQFAEGLARYVVLLTPLAVDNTRTIRATLLTTAGASACLLLIAGLNLCTLLISRGLMRTREAALKAAIGCGRARLIRQYLTEAALLCVCGSIGGVVLAAFAIRVFTSWNPLGTLPPHPLSINWHVLAFTMGAIGALILVTGLVPAIRASRFELAALIASGEARATAGPASPRLQLTVLVVQMAASLVLAAMTLLLVRTFSELQNTPLGFDADHLAVVSLALPTGEFDTSEKRVAAYEALSSRLGLLPGVEQVGASTSPPLSSGAPVSVRADAHEGDVPLRISEQDVTASYFRTVRVPVVAGRAFEDHDTRDSTPVAIVNQSAARLLFESSGDVVGRHIRIMNDSPREIVGVVGDTQSTFYNSLEWRTNPVIFLPALQSFAAIRDPTVRSFGLHVLLRTSRMVTMSDVKPIASAVNRNMVVTAVTTTASQVAEATRQPRLRMTLLGWFGGASLILAGIGVYGVVAQIVAARRREFGVRVALGAAAPRLVRSLVSKVVMLGIGASACGGLLLVALRQTIKSLLYGVQPLDVRSFTFASGVLLGVLAIAALIPALRLIAVSPVEVLRSE
jgi:predicted permease